MTTRTTDLSGQNNHGILFGNWNRSLVCNTNTSAISVPPPLPLTAYLTTPASFLASPPSPARSFCVFLLPHRNLSFFVFDCIVWHPQSRLLPKVEDTNAWVCVREINLATASHSVTGVGSFLLQQQACTHTQTSIPETHTFLYNSSYHPWRIECR